MGRTRKYKRIELHSHTYMSKMDSVCFPEKMLFCADQCGIWGLAITDTDGVQAFPAAYNAYRKAVSDDKDAFKTDKDFRIFYGVETHIYDDRSDENELFSTLLIARDPEGLRDIYALLTEANTVYRKHLPALSKTRIEKCKKHIIVGSCSYGGELSVRYEQGRLEQLKPEDVSLYDFVEFEPPVFDEEKNEVKNILGFVKAHNICGVASNNVKYYSEKAFQAYAALRMKEGDKSLHGLDQYFMSGEELVKAFAFLGEEEAEKVVYYNPWKLVRGVEVFPPFNKFEGLPETPQTFAKFKTACEEGLKSNYGEVVPDVVKERYDAEIGAIERNGYAPFFAIAWHVTEKCREMGYPTSLRGNMGASLTAYLSGISEINPLPPHYRCRCGYSDFDVYGIDGFHWGDVGTDLPDRVCPKCGAELIKDGYDLESATFFDVHFDRIPDININVAKTVIDDARGSIREVEGIKDICMAGCVHGLTFKEAYEIAEAYYINFWHGRRKNNKKIDEMAEDLMGVKSEDCTFGSKVFVIPEGQDIHAVTPLDMSGEGNLLRTHMQHYDIAREVMRICLIPHVDLDFLKALKNDTGVEPVSIPLDDPKVLSMLTSTKALGISSKDICGVDVGTLGIREIGRSEKVRQMLKKAGPDKLSDLIRFFGFIHGSYVWNENAEELLGKGHKLYECIANRDDISIYLTKMGISHENACKIMDFVRKGKSRFIGMPIEMIDEMKEHGIPDWYIESLQKPEYLFPKAHNANYAVLKLRILYYKLYYPEAFYKRWLEFYARSPKEKLEKIGRKEAIEAYERAKESDGEEQDIENLKEELLVIIEMYARGISFNA